MCVTSNRDGVCPICGGWITLLQYHFKYDSTTNQPISCEEKYVCTNATKGCHYESYQGVYIYPLTKTS